MTTVASGYSFYSIPGDGATDTFPLQFALGVLKLAYVLVYVDGEVDGEGAQVYRQIESVPGDSGMIKVLGGVVPSGVNINFQRVVPKDLLIHLYANGSVLDYPSLDESHQQLAMMMHEVLDGIGLKNVFTDINMNGFKITNIYTDLDDPASVATIGALGTYRADALEAAATAAESAVTASASADAAAESAVTASASADAAAADADDAEASALASAASAAVAEEQQAVVTAEGEAQVALVIAEGDTQVDRVLTTGDTVVALLPGLVSPFSGNFGGAGNKHPINVKTGTADLRYALCDGATYTAPDGRVVTTPDLRERFVLPANTPEVAGTIGGSWTHSHTTSINATTLGIGQIPSHSHNIGLYNQGSNSVNRSFLQSDGNPTLLYSSNSGGGGSHTHGAVTSTEWTPQPFYRLAYIMAL